LKQLKAITVIVSLVLALLLTSAMYAQDKQVKKEKPSSTATAVQSKQSAHEEGSAACLEKHAKGECKGHEPGQPHMEKGDNPGHGQHAEGSAACLEKHAKGECKGHEPGQPHDEPRK